MAVKKGGSKNRGGSGNASSGKGKPNWTPYVAAVTVVFISLAVYSVLYPTPSHEEDVVAPEPRVPQRPIAEVEAQMRQLSTSLGGVGNKGSTPVFKQIQAMADAATDVLTRAEAATTEDERREILEAGLAAKSDWLATMSDQTTRLRAEEDAEKKEKKDNDPLSYASGDVTTLTKTTFSEYLRKNPRAMVEFYAPWCGHCKKLVPEYEQCARQFKGKAGFAAVDGTAEEQLNRIFEVGGYPTLKWFVRGRPIDYSGPRTAEKIAAWVEERLQPAYEDIEALTDLSAALEHTNGATAICSGSGDKSSELFKAFEAASEQLRGKKMLFLWTPDAPEGKQDSIMLHKLGDEPVPCIAQGIPLCQTADEVIEWLQKAWIDL